MVCVDDRFPRPLSSYYLNLPMKGKTYTIRAVFIGRGVIHPARETTHGEIGLLFEELVNRMDPRHSKSRSWVFNSARYALTNRVKSI